MRRLVWGALSAGWAAGCSLTSLVDLELVTCEDGKSSAQCNEQVCAPLNDAEGISETDCDVYQYASGGGCELSPRDWDGDGFVALDCQTDATRGDCDDRTASVSPDAAERCGGGDQDCDGIIDEGVFLGPSRGEPVSDALADTFDVIRYASDQQPFALVSSDRVTRDAEPVRLIDFRTGNSDEVTPRGFAESDLNTPPADEVRAQGCPADSGATLSACVLAEMAAAGPEDQRIAAAIDTRGCAQGGLLRVGYLDGHNFIQRGPAARSNVFRGLDLRGGQQDCALVSGDAARGGTRPNVAVSSASVGTSRAGLVVWLSGPPSEGCGDESLRDVMALGVWLETDPANAARRFVNAADNGTPVRLGQTGQGAAPALWASEVRGDDSTFVVAYRDRRDGPLVVRSIVVPKGPPFVAGDPDVARATAAITVGAAYEIEGSKGGDQPHLTPGPREDVACGDDRPTLAVTFRTFCGTSQAVDHLALVALGPDGSPCPSKAPVALGTFDDRRHPTPALALYTSDTLVSPWYEPSDASDANAEGGFIVLSTAGTAQAPGLRATRVLEATLEPLDSLDFLDRASSPFAFRSEGLALTLAYRDDASDRMQLRPLACTP